MKPLLFYLVMSTLAAPVVASVAAEHCAPGIYRNDGAAFMVVTRTDKGLAFTSSSGAGAGTAAVCGKDGVIVDGVRWPRVATSDTDIRFDAGGVTLAGRLIEPPGAGKDTPLVVLAHGSEASGWIGRARDPYQLVGRGVSVFVYDKRGTGGSGGDYTQNFPRLSSDLVAASQQARRLAAGRHGRFGLIGLSQGGWIVQLAARDAQAQFIGIGYGLAVDIAEQDAAQVALRLRERGYGEGVVAIARTLTDITAKVVRSGRQEGLDELAAAQARYGKAPWFAEVRGGYSGVLLNMPVDELRERGVPQFDKLDVDWSFDAMRTAASVAVPQLWAFAEQDRQAPGAASIERLRQLRRQGRDIAIYRFPGLDHGMRHYNQAADGARTYGATEPAFYDLMADWARGQLAARYGAVARD